jgi:YidC/Oxa1 family membrane protein insertase
MSPYTLLDPAVRVADAIVVAVSHVLAWPGGGAAVVLGVVALTLIVRAALLPLALRGVRADLARTALLPELERIRRRHAGDPTRIARETTEVYRRAGVSPLAGVGPALLQLPVLATLYRVVVAPTVGGHPNVVLSASVLGGPLSAHWPVLLSSAGLLSGAGAGFAALAVALLAIAWFASRQAKARQVAAAVLAATTAPTTVAAGASGWLARVGRWAPYGTVVFAALSPVGVGCYLLVTTAWSAAERALLPRLA